MDILSAALIIPLHDSYVDIDRTIIGNHTEVLPDFAFRDWSQERCWYVESGVDNPSTFDTPVFLDDGNKVTWSGKK